MRQCFSPRHYTSARVVRSLLLVAFIPLDFSAPCLAAGPTLEWIRQFGTPGSGSNSDNVQGLSLDGLGSLYISGITRGSLGGPNAGGQDSFLGKFDVAGNQQWIRQFGTPTSGFRSGWRSALKRDPPGFRNRH